MPLSQSPSRRPPIHLPAAESDVIADLALRAKHRQPVVAAMLLEEIERAELHGPDTMPDGTSASDRRSPSSTIERVRSARSDWCCRARPISQRDASRS